MNYLIDELKKIQNFALKNQTCKRKAVGCSIVRLSIGWQKAPTEETLIMTHNGPSVPNNQCTNEVGNCGCSHAEPRAILKSLKKDYGKHLTMVCTYSPCTNCANIIIDSGIIDLVVYKVLTQHDIRGQTFLLQSEVKILTEHNLLWPIKEHHDIIARIRKARYDSI